MHRRAACAWSAPMLLALGACVPVPPAPPGQFSDGQSAVIDGSAPASNTDMLVAQRLLRPGTVAVVQQNPRGGPAHGLLRFDGLVGDEAGQIPVGATVYQARLGLVTTDAGSGAAFHRLLSPWTRNSTWDDYAEGSKPIGVAARQTPDLVTGFVFPGPRDFDVTVSVQAWVDGADNRGWVLLPLGPDRWEFAGFAAADAAYRPQLSVLWGAPGPSVSVAAGDADQTSAVVWLRTRVAGPVRLTVSTAPDFGGVEREFSLEASDPAVPLKVEVQGLTPGVTYHYAATNAAADTANGTFKTPAGVERRGLRFAVTGDWRGELAPYPVIRNMPAARPDFVIALGDTIYADFPSPAVPKPQCQTLEDFRRKHDEVYSAHFGCDWWSEVRANTVWYAQIDDHEVTNDFSGGAPPASDPRFDGNGQFINETELYRRALTAFHEFNPLRDEYYGDTGEPLTANKRKLYRYRTFGLDAAMLLLDERSFRDAALDDAAIRALGPSGGFFEAAFAPGRTMLGRVQLDELKADLLDAASRGVTWKFVVVPEPIQNLGPILGTDRFEGYAAERTEILRFIDEQNIENVVFISADIHCTIINNLEYQLGFGQPQIPSKAWEITTGAVAFAKPFGPLAVDIARNVPLLGPVLDVNYARLNRNGKDRLLADALDTLLLAWGYDPVGLDGSNVPATLVEGNWYSMNTYGWTQFDIDADTQTLTVTTYGIDWYDEAELLGDPLAIVSRQPQVVSRFEVAAAAAQ